MITQRKVDAVNLRLREESKFIKKLLPVIEPLMGKKVITTSGDLIKRLRDVTHKVHRNLFYLEFNKLYNNSGYISLNSYIKGGGHNIMFIARVENQRIEEINELKKLTSSPPPKQYVLKEVQRAEKDIEKYKKFIKESEENIRPFIHL